MSKGRVERLKAIQARSFGDNCHERHEDPDEAVLKDTKPNDLLSQSANRRIEMVLGSQGTDIEPRQTTFWNSPHTMISAPTNSMLKPIDGQNPILRCCSSEVIFLTV